jgi:hypothetical protein
VLLLAVRWRPQRQHAQEQAVPLLLVPGRLCLCLLLQLWLLWWCLQMHLLGLQLPVLPRALLQQRLAPAWAPVLQR